MFPPTRNPNPFDPDHDSSFRSTLYGTNHQQLHAISTSSSSRSQQQEAFDESLDYGFDELLYPQYSLDQDGEPEMSASVTRAAWDQLGDILGYYDDEISDSESVGSSGLLDFRNNNNNGRAGRRDGDGSEESISDYDMDEDDAEKRNRNEWEHIR